MIAPEEFHSQEFPESRPTSTEAEQRSSHQRIEESQTMLLEGIDEIKKALTIVQQQVDDVSQEVASIKKFSNDMKHEIRTLQQKLTPSSASVKDQQVQQLEAIIDRQQLWAGKDTDTASKVDTLLLKHAQVETWIYNINQLVETNMNGLEKLQQVVSQNDATLKKFISNESNRIVGQHKTVTKQELKNVTSIIEPMIKTMIQPLMAISLSADQQKKMTEQLTKQLEEIYDSIPQVEMVPNWLLLAVSLGTYMIQCFMLSDISGRLSQMVPRKTVTMKPLPGKNGQEHK
jgi:hypothetical protein